MIKLLKWIYELGVKRGWDNAVEAVREGHNIITSNEGERLRIRDETIVEMMQQESAHKGKE